LKEKKFGFNLFFFLCSAFVCVSNWKISPLYVFYTGDVLSDERLISFYLFVFFPSAHRIKEERQVKEELFLSHFSIEIILPLANFCKKVGYSGKKMNNLICRIIAKAFSTSVKNPQVVVRLTRLSIDFH
jgi:hypothetical protein